MSYYAIGVAWPLSILNFALYGLFIPTLDLAYVPAWNVSVERQKGKRGERRRLPELTLFLARFSDHSRSSRRLLGCF